MICFLIERIILDFKHVLKVQIKREIAAVISLFIHATRNGS